MQNEPNLQNAKMNVCMEMTNSYNQNTRKPPRKNEPKTNPIHKAFCVEFRYLVIRICLYSVVSIRRMYFGFRISCFGFPSAKAEEILQNEPNFKTAKMIARTNITSTYEDLCVFEPRKNEPNSNPICSELVEPMLI